MCPAARMAATPIMASARMNAARRVRRAQILIGVELARRMRIVHTDPSSRTALLRVTTLLRAAMRRAMAAMKIMAMAPWATRRDVAARGRRAKALRYTGLVARRLTLVPTMNACTN